MKQFDNETVISGGSSSIAAASLINEQS